MKSIISDGTKKHLKIWCDSYFYADEAEDRFDEMMAWLGDLSVEDYEYSINKGWIYTYNSIEKKDGCRYHEGPR